MADRIFDASNAKVRLFTFKEGLLSKVAHDLELSVPRFSLRVVQEGDAVSAISGRFETGSIEVLHAVTSSGSAAISDSDKKTIRRNIENDVLHSARFPEAVFSSTRIDQTESGWRVLGSLALHGQSREIAAQIVAAGKGFRTEIDLHQPDWGIKPYSAMMGTLRVQPRVRVVVETW